MAYLPYKFHISETAWMDGWMNGRTDGWTGRICDCDTGWSFCFVSHLLVLSVLCHGNRSLARLVSFNKGLIFAFF